MYRNLAQWAHIRHRLLVGRVSQRQICRETGISRTVIAKIAAQPFPPPPAARPITRRKIDPYLSLIRQLMMENATLPPAARLSAKQIHQRLQQEGFSGGYTTVRTAVRDFVRSSAHNDTGISDATRIWESISDILVSLPCASARDFLRMLSRADPPLISRDKAERFLGAAAGTIGPSERKPREAKRMADQEWMYGVLHGALALRDIESRQSDFPELKPLLHLVAEGRLTHRKKALAVLASRHGLSSRRAAELLGMSRVSYTKYVQAFERGGVRELLARKISGRRKVDDEAIKQAVFSILHQPPGDYGINRTSWKRDDLIRVLGQSGHPACKTVVQQIIKRAGYRWTTARTVLTSRDPDYSTKLDHIHAILSGLQEDEAFFSIDEFGPFSVKARGGRTRTAPGEQRVIPQWQESKGCLIMTAALELSSNQVTHFYSDNKNTAEMIRMMEQLVAQYKDRRRIYLSWDAASWHISKQLKERIDRHNALVATEGEPLVEIAPLPSGAQFLNVIESVFSGMAKAIIHNSDYSSVEAAKAAIDRYFAERNANFTRCPRRAGKKIWGKECEPPEFRDGNNCKNPHYR
jgi:transposase